MMTSSKEYECSNYSINFYSKILIFYQRTIMIVSIFCSKYDDKAMTDDHP